MKKTASYIICMALACACIYPYNPDLSKEETERILVVDGEIVAGGTSVFRLFYTQALQENTTKTAMGKAWVEDEAGNKYFDGTGAWKSVSYIPTPELAAGNRYRAGIIVDGETYYSEWLTPVSAPQISAISFDADDNNVYVLADLDGGKSATGYIGITFDETWEFHSDLEAELVIDPNTWQYPPMMEQYPYYWCWKSMETHTMVLVDYSDLSGTRVKGATVRHFSRTDSRNHKKYSIQIKARNLSKEAYEYINYVQDVTSGGSNLFTPDPGTMEGNLHCETDPEKKVMGLVHAACAVSSRAFPDSRYLKYIIPDESLLVIVQEEDYAYYYNERGYRPVKKIVREEQSGVGWGPERCINCIVAGGTQDKPDFWE